MRRLYTVLALAIVLLYGLAAWRGWGLTPSRRGLVPPDVRQAPGGYRSYSFWRGGK